MRFLLTILIAGLFTTHAMAQETLNTKVPLRHGPGGRAGVAIEPMLIFSQEEANIKTSQLPVISDDTSGQSRGFGAGLKLGMHVSQILILGVDGRYSRSKMSDSAYGDANGDKYTFGPTLGAQMPLAGLRLWATYVLAGDFDPDSGRQGFDLRFKDPRGYRVGAGLHFGPVSMNLEFEELNFDQTVIQSFGAISPNFGTNVDFVSRGYFASLSFPLEL